MKLNQLMFPGIFATYFMRYLVLTLILVFVNSNAQKRIDKTDSLKLSIVQELHQKQIKEFFFLVQTSSSPIVTESEHTTVEKIITDFTGYAFWKENSKTFIRKFDYRGKFNGEEIIAFKGFDLISKNLNKIKSESLLPYAIRKEDGYEALFSPNGYQYGFFFTIDSVVFEKQFRIDGLIKNDYIDRPEMENTNYSKNNDLKLVKLFNLCQDAVKNLETKKLIRI